MASTSRFFIFLAAVFFISAIASSANALELRFFALGNLVEASEMNGAFVSQDLQEIRQLPGVGFEFTAEPVTRLHFGIRSTQSKLHVGDGKGTALTGGTNFSELHAETLSLIFRWTIADGSPVRFDIFGGAGGIRARMKSAKSGAEYEQGVPDPDMRLVQYAGASLMLGGPTIYLTLEGGHMWAPIESLRRTTGATPVVQKLELSGPFAVIGVSFNFDGMNPSSGSGSSGSSGRRLNLHFK